MITLLYHIQDISIYKIYLQNYYEHVIKIKNVLL